MRSRYTKTVGRFAPMLIALLLVGCAAPVMPPLILVPAPTQRSATYYQEGKPIAAVASESTSVLISADEWELNYTPYLRLWVLYFNRMNHPVLLDPIHSVVVRASAVDHSSERRVRRRDPGAVVKPEIHVTLPELPYKMLAEAENAKTRAEILAVFGGALQSAAATAGTQATTVHSTEGWRATVNDRDEKVTARTDAIGRRTDRRIDDINAAHEMFAASFNSGALRKHTVFPQSGVNGYLYIPVDPYFLSGEPWPRGGTTYTVIFSLPGLSDTLTFSSSAGE